MRYILRVPLFRLVAILGLLSFGAAFLGSHSVGAVSSGPSVFITADNTFYAYAKGGEKINATFTKSSLEEPGGVPKYPVTISLDGPGLEAQKCVIPKEASTGAKCSFSDVVAPENGIYRISVVLPDDAKPYPEVSPTVRWGGNMLSWNIAVNDGATEKTGRVWSELYAARQPVQDSYLANLTYYYVSESGYIYRAAYKGYNGQISTFSADAVGVRKGDDCQPAYKSIEVADTKFSPSFGKCGGSYKLFFEQPAGDLPATAKKWDNKTNDWILSPAAAPTVSDLKFESDKTGDAQSGTITFKLKNFVGQYSVDIDTTGNGDYVSKEDVRIKRTAKKVDNTTQTVKFDGVDATGQVVPASQTINIRINVDKVAEIHLVNADVEGRTGGLELTRLNAENAPSSRMCWNDTELPLLANASLQTPTLDGRDCPDSTKEALHGWVYSTGSWGDARYIDDWAYASTKINGTSTIQYPDSNEPLAASAMGNKTRQAAIFIGAGVLLLLFVTLIVIFVVKRRRHAALIKNAAQNHQPLDYPGPGDPRPPGL